MELGKKKLDGHLDIVLRRHIGDIGLAASFFFVAPIWDFPFTQLTGNSIFCSIYPLSLLSDHPRFASLTLSPNCSTLTVPSNPGYSQWKSQHLYLLHSAFCLSNRAAVMLHNRPNYFFLVLSYNVQFSHNCFIKINHNLLKKANINRRVILLQTDVTWGKPTCLLCPCSPWLLSEPHSLLLPDSFLCKLKM